VRNNKFDMKVTFSGPANKTYNVQAVMFQDKNVSNKATQVTGTGAANVTFDAQGKATQTFTTSQALDDWVDIHPMQWQWQYFDPVAMKWKNITKTGSLINAVDAKPLATSDGQNYWDVVRYACEVAAGQKTTTKDEVFQAIWAAMKTRKQNAYGFTFTYWGPFASAAAYTTVAQNNTPGLLANQDGRCAAWGAYFSDVCKDQGIAVQTFGVTPPAGYWLFLANSLTLGAAKASPPAPNATDVYKSEEVTWNAGLPAQGIATPGPAAGATQPDRNTMWVGKTFVDHCLTYRDLNNNGTRDVKPTVEPIYDPSYGNGPYQKLIDWKVPALGAFVSRTRYPLPGGKNGFWEAKPNPAALEITPPAAGFNLP
jgi:hypothetical protein